MSPVGPPTNTSSKTFPEETRNGQRSVVASLLTSFLLFPCNQNTDTSIPSGGKTASLHQELTRSMNSPGHSHSLTNLILSKRFSAAKCLCLAHSLAQIPHGPWKPVPAPVPAPEPPPTPQAPCLSWLVDSRRYCIFHHYFSAKLLVSIWFGFDGRSFQLCRVVALSLANAPYHVTQNLFPYLQTSSLVILHNATIYC